MDRPTCGHCGYDLTGAESNRCPECGLLFIQAGVNLRRDSLLNARNVRRVVFILFLALVGVGVVTATMWQVRLQAVRAQAAAATQAAASAKQAVIRRMRQQSAQRGNASSKGANAQAPRAERRKLETDPIESPSSADESDDQ